MSLMELWRIALCGVIERSLIEGPGTDHGLLLVLELTRVTFGDGVRKVELAAAAGARNLLLALILLLFLPTAA